MDWYGVVANVGLSTMTTDLTEVFEAFLAKNRGPDGTSPEYGICAVADTPSLNDIRLTLTFKAGRRYCCGEPGCHFPLDWARLREVALKGGIHLGHPLRVRVHGVVEAGSVFSSTVQAGGPEANQSYTFDEIYVEAAQEAPLPLPDWAITEATRRRDEMLADPNLGSAHEEVWKRIDDSRDG